MASYDRYYDIPRGGSKRYVYEERRTTERDPVSSKDLVSRREDSDLSIEEIRREFSPPGASSRHTRRARSAEPGYYDDYDDRRAHHGRDRDYDRDYGYERRLRGKGTNVYYEEEQRKEARMLSKQDQIIAAVTGAALAIGGKELYDRRDGKENRSYVQRDLLTSAALGAAGAFAGYQGTELYNKQKEKEEKKSTHIMHKGRDGRLVEYYSDDETEKHKKGHKNFLEGALAAAGLGGAVKALTGKDDRSDTRSRASSRSRSRSRIRSHGEGANKIQKAAMASLIAGATEAFRVSKQPGAWKGEKAKRVLTAALGAGTIDAAQDSGKAGSKLGIAEAVIGGLIGNRVMHGSKKEVEADPRTGRSRSRSRAPSRAKDGSGGGVSGVSGLTALATAGLGAFGAKKMMEDHRDRSRPRRRSMSGDSYDSRNESPDQRRRSRSRSVADTARKGLARLGIGTGPDEGRGRGSRRSHNYDDYDGSRSEKYRRGSHDSYDRDGRHAGRYESDLGDSEEDRKEARKLKGKQFITAALAGVATIHAAHGVHQSMRKWDLRHKAVKEARLSLAEADRVKSKAALQNAVSFAIATLGIHSAMSELKEARELSQQVRDFEGKKQERHGRRLRRQERLRQG